MTQAQDRGDVAEDATDRSVRQRFEMALRAGRVGTWRWDITSGLVDWDASMCELFGFGPGEFDGSYPTYLSRVHPDDRAEVEASIRRTLDDRAPGNELEHRVLLPNGSVRWFRSTAQLLLDEQGDPAELFGVAVDVSERRQAELERAAAMDAEDLARNAVRAAQRRIEMMARVSVLVDTPLDLDATLQQIADLAITEMADWCVVDVREDGVVHLAALAHRDPEMVATVKKIQERYPGDPRNPEAQHLMRTLEPLFVRQIPDEVIEASAHDEEHLRLLRSLNLTSYLAVPLQAFGRGVGVMLLASSNGRQLDEEDVNLAREFGIRAGSAVVKARMHDRLQTTARVLQQSLVPAHLPRIDGLQLSAHYRSGTAGVDIGGDYYDVFRTSPDRWWVVLGDVCGKGPEAAALAGAVRYSLRAIAAETDDPATALTRLNEVVLAEDWSPRFTTIVVATFLAPRPGADSGQSDDGTPLTLRLVSGGHPPALVRRLDGKVEALSCEGTLIGLLPELHLETVEATLDPGDTLMLYTDGATEARLSTGEELGQSRLTRLLASEGADPDDLASRIASDLVARAGEGLRDDLCLFTLTRV
ncbi:MAG TPA: SpoIIE family protein phosphatase [Actinomycetales bacterium]|nr:SpoIIE family protein phosphatase [Actinomycetales bacterium]